MCSGEFERSSEICLRIREYRKFSQVCQSLVRPFGSNPTSTFTHEQRIAHFKVPVLRNECGTFFEFV